ncbi:hypothetical protein BJ944DRAFT_288351 [Cunninghamella echinulata]|nr:hypothetical protein BJ944DRAFT_288351 [Cunninghamella echinulata]
MRSSYSEIQPLEKAILQDQYEDSPFYKKQKHLTTKPIHLEIFDFDSTLFLSPSLSPTLWHPSLIHELVGEDVYGPGWWRDIRSLELGPIDQLEKTQWKGYWNEDIVQEARRSLADPTIMTVLLTGRRKIPFYSLISRMVKAKQLDFDLLGLRPDPTQEDHDKHVQQTSSPSDNHHQNKKRDCIVYGANSIFMNTMDFKQCFILNLLHNIPSLTAVTMWDDRLPHVKKFNFYLEQLIDNKLIQKGKVNYVPGIRPKYRPKWEAQVVHHIFTSHDANEILFREQQLWNSNIKPLTWDHYTEGEEEEEIEKEEDDQHHQHQHHHFYLRSALSSSSSSVIQPPPLKHISLTELPSNTIVKLSKETISKLRKRYEPYYHKKLKFLNKNIKGWRTTAETPLWFGDRVILSSSVFNEFHLNRYGGLGKKVNVIVRSISSPDPELGFVALIQLQPTEATLREESAPPPELIHSKHYILPLIYKPSMAISIQYKRFTWNRVASKDQIKGTGEIAYGHLIGLDATIDDPSLNTTETTVAEKRTLSYHESSGTSHYHQENNNNSNNSKKKKV